MLLNLTLDPAVDTAEDARKAMALIALAFHIGYTADAAVYTEEDAKRHLDPAAIFGGQTQTTPDRTVVTRDASTGALQAHSIPGVEIDKDGLPWDGRIHASTKSKNQDGRWKKKKNVEDADVTRVEAELRSIMAIPTPSAPAVTQAPGIPANPETVVPPPPPVVDTAAVPPPPPAAVVPAPPAPTPAPAGAADAMTFPKLMAWVGPHMAAGRLTAASVADAMKTLGIVDGTGNGSLALLATRPDLVPGAHGYLCTLVGAE